MRSISGVVAPGEKAQRKGLVPEAQATQEALATKDLVRANQQVGYELMLTSSKVRSVFFAKTYAPIGFGSIADVNGNGAPDLVVLGSLATVAAVGVFYVASRLSGGLSVTVSESDDLPRRRRRAPPRGSGGAGRPIRRARRSPSPCAALRACAPPCHRSSRW